MLGAALEATATNPEKGKRVFNSTVPINEGHPEESLLDRVHYILLSRDKT